MAIEELTKVEAEEVSGGIIGDLIQGSANLFARQVNFFVGPNFGPITAIAKQANDSWYALGSQLGGNTQQVPVNYNPTTPIVPVDPPVNNLTNFFSNLFKKS